MDAYNREDRDIGYNLEKTDPFGLDNCIDKGINSVVGPDNWPVYDIYFHTIVYYTVAILSFFVIKVRTPFI